MPQFILRDLPSGLWDKVTLRAEREGWPLRALMLGLLKEYAAGRARPAAAPPAPISSPAGWLAQHRHAFPAMRDEAQRLIDSPATYLHPALAFGTTGGPHLYTRFAKQLTLLEDNAILDRGGLPGPQEWVQRPRPLDRRDLQALVDQATLVLGLLAEKTP